MVQQTEAQALDSVRFRLAERFPEAGQDAVDTAVSAAHAEMTGPVRDYVPVLVERVARDRLARQLHRSPQPTPPPAQPHR